ncbi:hypothetical protein CBL_21507, partial [Carabus blaptoides fortunei]
EATCLIQAMETEVLPRWGYPRAILSDNGRQFISQEWQNACRRWKCERWTTAIYNPRANPAERRNQEVKKGLRLHLHNQPHKHWDKHLPSVLFQLRCRRNAATGLSPSEALLGVSLNRPGDWRITNRDRGRGHNEQTERQERHEQISNRTKRYQTRYAKERTNPPASYNVGQAVLTRTHPLSRAATGHHAGFTARWEGPHRVVDVAGPST